jgi:osmoprotectant transport system ATP-binding protein
LIEFKNVTKKYGNKEAVKTLDLHLEKGSITMLIGPSGCGKTTTLKMINRLIEPTSGEILINGEATTSLDPVQLRRKIGYVIQDVGLFPHYSVYDNIALVPRLLKWDEDRIKKRVEELLDLVTLNWSYASKYPLQLSGGERQRVGIARGLSADPDVLLMDEPFGAIDPINREVLQESFLEIQEEIKKTIVFVTHDINEAIKLGDRLAIMKDGELIQYDTVDEILQNPEDEFVEDLLGQDRNLKALSLKKVKEFVQAENGFVKVPQGTDREQVRNLLLDKKGAIAYVLDDSERLIGRYIYKKVGRGKTAGRDLILEKETESLERNASLTEALSFMLQVGEKKLPVLTRNRKFTGVISLSDIFAQVSTQDSDNSSVQRES